jgi:hypothetical protein
MAETFQTRIPTLSDSELEEYLRNYSKYELEAVEAALAELKKRGHRISDDEINSVRISIQNRDAGDLDRDPITGIPLAQNRFRIGRQQIRKIAIMLLVLGLGSATTIYFTAVETPAGPLGFDPLDSKKGLRELEVYGGQANVFSVEIQQWFSSLWHGRTLGVTVGVLTVFFALVFWFLASHQASVDFDRSENQTKPGGKS